MHNNIARNIEQKDRVSVLVLLDLSAAFDAVDHALLLETLANRFGIHGAALTSYRSYLTKRTQTFQVGRERSTTYVVSCSIPQRSVLGPAELYCLHRGPSGGD